jgi:four helix bundle protein
MQDYKKLEVWSKAHMLVKEIYTITKDFPKEELFGIVSQIRRAAVSIPTNIAEGSGKASQKDFGRYLQIAFGSANEVEYLLLLSFELSFVKNEDYQKTQNKIEQVKKMLSGLLKVVDGKRLTVSSKAATSNP